MLALQLAVQCRCMWWRELSMVPTYSWQLRCNLGSYKNICSFSLSIFRLCPGTSNTISLAIVLLQVNYSTALLSFIPNIPAVFDCFAALFCFFRCGHCKKLAPEFESAATRLKGTVTLAKVNTGDGNDHFWISWLGSHCRNVLSSRQIRLYLQCLWRAAN